MGKSKSLASNSIYYMIYNVLNILFPFMTGIYVSRVLLPHNIGEIQYAQNIVQYFVILAYLGLPTYGLREVSKTRDEKDNLNKLYTELFTINLISTVFFTVAYTVMVLSVPQFRTNLSIYLIVGLAIALNALNISWLFEGLEEFRFISIRNIVFKAVAFLALVIFVRNEDDYLKYAVITVIGTAGNYIVNMLYSGRFAKLVFHDLDLKRHLRPVITLVTVNLAIEIYSLVDVTMLGNLCDKESVAFYSYGHRIQRILLQIINTFTMVTVPRLSYHYKKSEYDQFNKLLSQTLSIIFVLSVPMIIGIIIVGKDLIVLLYSQRFIRSAYVLQILSPLLLISPIGYLLGSRVLLVSDHESKMIISVSVGAIVNVIGNYFFIQLYHEYGAAIASVISEIVVMVIYVIMGRKYYKLVDVKACAIKTVVSTLIMTSVLLVMSFIETSEIISIFAKIIIAVPVYFISMILLKEKNTVNYFEILKRKLLND